MRKKGRRRGEERMSLDRDLPIGGRERVGEVGFVISIS